MQKYLQLVIIGVAIQFSLASIEHDLQNLNLTGLPELPDEISSFQKSLPSQEEVEKALAEKCKKNAGQGAYEKAMTAKEKIVECVKGLVNFDQLTQEMEAAKPTGDLDSVFKKYCKKSPEFKGCVSNFTTTLMPCLEESEKGSVATILNVTEQLSEFICYKEGDRIALFIAEGGPECLNASKDAIQECMETVFKNSSKPERITLDALPLLLFKADQCQDFFELQTCVVHQLEKCKEPTPANIVESLFNFIRKVTPCSSYKFTDSKAVDVKNTNSGSSVHSFLSSASTILFCYSALRLIGHH